MSKKICPFMAIVYYAAVNGKRDLGQGWDCFCIYNNCEMWDEEGEVCLLKNTILKPSTGASEDTP